MNSKTQAQRDAELEESFDMFFDANPGECDCCGSTDNLVSFPAGTANANGYSRCQNCINKIAEERESKRAADEERDRKLNWYGSQPE